MIACTRKKCIGLGVLGFLGFLWAPLLLLFFSSASLEPDRAEAGEAEIPRRSVVVRVAEASSPAVVNISTEISRNRRLNPFYQFGGGNPFEDFFRDFFESPSQTRSSLGSGVIIRSDGTILTNEHVILRADKIRVTLLDGREFEGKLVGSDPESDLAVVKIEGQAPFPTIKMGTSQDLMIGETVIAIGNPFGLSHTVTAGVVSSIHRSIRSGDRIYRDFIQTDASINPGNSGGPLLNIGGELVGINTAVYREGQGIGFAIPVDRVKRIVDDLIAYGEVHPAWVGIQVQAVDPSLLKHFQYSGKGGVVVTRAVPDGPGEKGGLEEGDIVERVGQIEVISLDDYYQAIRQFTAGDEIDFVISRDTKRIRLSVRGGLFLPDYGLRLARSVLGIEVADIDEGLVQRYGLYAHEGVVVTSIDRTKILGRIGVQPGDIVRQIGDQAIWNLEDYAKATRVLEMRRNILFQIQRGPWANYVTVDMWEAPG